MKKLLTTMLLFSALLFSGCSNDLTDEYLSLIPGEWVATEDSEAWRTFHFELRFLSNSSVQFLMQDQEVGDFDAMDEENYGFNEYGSYTIDDDEILVKTENLFYTGEITKLNDSSLTIKRTNVYGKTVYDYFIKQ